MRRKPSLLVLPVLDEFVLPSPPRCSIVRPRKPPGKAMGPDSSVSTAYRSQMFMVGLLTGLAVLEALSLSSKGSILREAG